MPTLAMRLIPTTHGKGIAPHGVLTARYDLQVIRVHAGANPAQMVQFPISRDQTAEDDKHDAVCVAHSPVPSHHSISQPLPRRDPQPASGVRLGLNLFADSLWQKLEVETHPSSTFPPRSTLPGPGLGGRPRIWCDT